MSQLGNAVLVFRNAAPRGLGVQADMVGVNLHARRPQRPGDIGFLKQRRLLDAGILYARFPEHASNCLPQPLLGGAHTAAVHRFQILGEFVIDRICHFTHRIAPFDLLFPILG